MGQLLAWTKGWPVFTKALLLVRTGELTVQKKNKQHNVEMRGLKCLTAFILDLFSSSIALE